MKSSIIEARPLLSKFYIRKIKLLSDENYVKLKIQELGQKIQKSKERYEQTRKEIEEIQNLIPNLNENIEKITKEQKKLNEMVKGLLSLKEELEKKQKSVDYSLNLLETKVIHHEIEESKLAKELIEYKNLSEEAMLSFQKFSFVSLGFLNQAASLIISIFNERPYINLQIGKQNFFLSTEPNCSVYLNPKRPNRFFIKLEDKTREFESPESEKIIFYINLAIQKSIES